MWLAERLAVRFGVAGHLEPEFPGFVGAAVGVAGRLYSGIGGQSPHTAGVLIQGATGRQAIGYLQQAIISPEIAISILIAIGLVIAILGPTWYWLGKPSFFRSTSRPDDH